MWHVWGEGKFTHGLGGETDEERPLERHRCKLGDNIKMDFKVVDRKGVEWNRWLKIVTIMRGFCENCNGHLVSIKFEGYLE